MLRLRGGEFGDGSTELGFTDTAWTAFTALVKTGALDGDRR